MLRLLTVLLFSLFLTGPIAGAAKGKAWTDYETAKKEDPDFSIQGEYGSGKDGKGVHVFALGEGKFDAYLLEGGLPGDGWDKSKSKIKISGKTEGDVTKFSGKDYSAEIKGYEITVKKGDDSYTLKRVERKSPTLGKKAPDGAVVLFDGTNVDQWEKGKLVNGLLQHGTMSKPKFQSYHLHLEFQTPYRPSARGQGRGNSGVYHQARYETQVLDSFALEGKMNETGGIYSIAAPKLNACLPPLSWQTYDVDFTTAVFENGKKVKSARMTVRLNGVLVQDDVELTKSTTASKLKEGPEPGPIYLQNHGNPVFYRNIWVIRK